MASGTYSFRGWNVQVSGGEGLHDKHEVIGSSGRGKRFHSKTTCMEAAGGARSSVEESLCAAGRTGRWEETRTRKGWKRSILMKIEEKLNGVGFTKAVAGGRQPEVGTK